MDNFFSSLLHVPDYLRLNDIPGHFSYLLIAVSYLLTNMFWLRVTAVMGLSLEILYFRLSGGDMLAGIGWDVVFILINLYQLFWLARERLLFSIPEPDRSLLIEAMPGLSLTKVHTLVKAGEIKTLQPGTEMAREWHDLENIYLIFDGEALVTLDKTELARVGSGNFIGEAAFLTDGMATATVSAYTPLRTLQFDSKKLRRLLNKDSDIANAMYELLGRDLVRKMRASNDAKRPADAILTAG